MAELPVSTDPALARAQAYLTLATAYCRELGGVRWSDHEDALVYPDGRFFAFNEAIALFLEGSGSARLHFAHVLHVADLILDGRHQNTPEISRIRHLFFGCGGYWRNAGAWAGVVCDAVPGVAEAPSLELVLGRLRDRVYPIRYYAGRFHDTGRRVEQPALGAAAFEEYFLRAAQSYNDDDLRSWFATGRGPVHEAGEALARERPAPRTLLGKLAALLERPRLAGAETYVTQLVGALALPPRRLARQQLPVGGYADMATQGNFEAILPGQFALDELEFFRRFVERELLFFRREEPPAHNKQELVVLLDQGVRTWGDIRLVLSAAAIALGKHAAQHKTPFLLATTGNDGRLVEPLGADFELLARLLEASDLSPDPGLALETVLQARSDASRDIVLLTQPRNLAAADVRHAALLLGQRDRLFALALTQTGQAELSELRHGTAVKVRQFRVGFVPARAPFEQPTSAGWTGSVEPIPFPFRFGADGSVGQFDFDYDGRWLVTAGREGMLHAWTTDGTSVEVLPRAYQDQEVLRDVQAMVGVAGGVVVAGRRGNGLQLVHYDLNKRRAVSYRFEGELVDIIALLYSRTHHAIVCKFSEGVAVDLETGATYSTKRGGPNSRARLAWEEVRQGTLRAREFSVYSVKPAGLEACFLRHGPTLEVVHGEASWPPFVPLADGQPLLNSARPVWGQKCGGTVALHMRRANQPDTLLLLQGPPGAVVGEYTLPGRDSKFKLAQNGAWLARQIGAGNIEVRPVGTSGTVFKTRAGGASHQVRLFLGPARLLLCVGASHRHWVSWQRAALESEYAHGSGSVMAQDLETWRQTGLLEANARAPVSGANYDSSRFVAEAVRGGMTFLADRHGQIAILDRDGSLVAMFMAFRERLAAWLPDGTQVGSPALLRGPATPDAATKIATALRRASH